MDRSDEIGMRTVADALEHRDLPSRIADRCAQAIRDEVQRERERCERWAQWLDDLNDGNRDLVYDCLEEMIKGIHTPGAEPPEGER